MLTSLTIRRFKRFRDVEIDLGNHVVFIGPNNSGKTTALQALALWDVGLRRWQEKRSGKETPTKRPGVTINRRDLISVPVPNAKLLWQDLHVRDVQKVDGHQQTQNICLEIMVEGVSQGKPWKCGLEFDYANEESFYCRPVRLPGRKKSDRMLIPAEASETRIAYLPPMSGLAATENRLDPGAISVLLGEGRTAEVLRNLCYQIAQRSEEAELWTRFAEHVSALFGVQLEQPRYVPERGEVTMLYQERSGAHLDISCSGRGLQQTALLLAHLYANPSTVLLLDEPDAHLEILRQRQIYQLLTDVAREQGSQVIAASHSEVLLNEAADRDVVVAFVGKPHRIDDRGSQVLKALKEIGFDQFYLAEQTGFVLYLEGSTDLAILRALADKLEHEAADVLERPFVRYVQNQPKQASNHFHGLREAKKDLVAFALFDRDAPDTELHPNLTMHKWQRCEIENYLCHRETLFSYADAFAVEQAPGPLFDEAERRRFCSAMDRSIQEIEEAMKKLRKGSPWSPNTKVSDDFLDPLFQAFFKELGLPNLMNKTDFHELARCVPAELIAPEVVQVLDGIVEVSKRARPAPE